MAFVERRWISDGAVNNSKIDHTETYTVGGLYSTADATVIRNIRTSTISVLNDATVGRGLLVGRDLTVNGGGYIDGDATIVGNLSVAGTTVITNTDLITTDQIEITQVLNTEALTASQSTSGTTAPVIRVSNKGLGAGVALENGGVDITNAHVTFQYMAPPAACTPIFGSSGVLTGTYTYKITFVTERGETAGGAVSAEAFPSAQRLNVMSIPTGPVGVVARRVYRTVNAGTIHKLVATINDNTTTTYVDNTPDGSLGAIVPSMNTTAGGIGSIQIGSDGIVKINRLGINEQVPDTLLHVTGADANFGSLLKLETTGTWDGPRVAFTSGPSSKSWAIGSQPSSAGYGFSIYEDGNEGVSGTERLMIMAGGNVGINTTSAEEALHVHGDVKVSVVLPNRVWTTPRVYNVLDYGAVPGMLASGKSGITTTSNNRLTQTGAFTNVSVGDILVLTSQQIDGTVYCTTDSASVTGTGTLFQSQLSVGDVILIQTREYRVGSISSQTSMTLATPYVGVTGGGESVFPYMENPSWPGGYLITGRTDDYVTVASMPGDKPFGVWWRVYKNNRTAIQAALDAASTTGGIVHAPEGVFAVYLPTPDATDSGLTIPPDVVFYGVWESTMTFHDTRWEDYAQPPRGTLLLCLYEMDSQSSAPVTDMPFINMKGNNITARGIQIYYPKQKYWRNTSSRLTVTNATFVTNFVTFTVPGHGLSVGDVIMVTGVAPLDYNGPYIVRSLDVGDPTNKFVVYTPHTLDPYSSGGFIYRKEPWVFPYTFKSNPLDGQGSWEDHAIYNVHMINPYYGIDFMSSHTHHKIDGLYGAPLKEGISIDRCGDVGRMSNIEFVAGNLFGYHHASNTSPYYRELFIVWTLVQVTGIHYYRTDGEMDHDIFVYGAKYGFKFSEGAVGGYPWGCFTNFQTDTCDFALYIEHCAAAGVLINNLRVIGWDVFGYSIPPVGNHLMGIYCESGNTGLLSITGADFYARFQNSIQWNGGLLSLSNAQFQADHVWLDSGTPLPILVNGGTAILSTVQFSSYFNGGSSDVLQVGSSGTVHANGMIFGEANTFSSTGVLDIIAHKNGCVGIGTVPYDQLLEIHGNWSSAGGNGIMIQNDYAGASAPTQIFFDRSAAHSSLRAAIGIDSTSRVFYIWVGGDRVNIDASGNVGIGTDTPVERLHVQGNLRVSSLAGSGNRAVYSDNNGTLTNTSSDARLKKGVIPLVYGLSEVIALNPVSYTWVDKARGEQPEIGLLAQEVRAIIPEVVGENADGMLSLDYPKLVAVLINAIKDQQDQIEDLKILVKAALRQ
jgi:hypothetical protein